MSSIHYKAMGNAAFQAGKHKEAVRWFSLAIQNDRENHILYSNRSAAYCANREYFDALADAAKTIELKPDWVKGWARKGAALHGTGSYKAALAAYEKGLELDPSNDACIKGIQDVNAAIFSTPLMFKRSFGPDVWERIKLRPQLAPYLEQSDYVELIKMVQKSGTEENATKIILSDERLQETLVVLTGGKVERSAAEDEAEKERRQREAEAYHDPEKAREAKERGNELFKLNKYPEAIREYDEAIKRNPDDCTFYSNRAACHMKTGDYLLALKDCEKALQLNPTFVRAMTRRAHCHFWLKEHDKALEWYCKGLESEPDNEELRAGFERTTRLINTAAEEAKMEERVRKAMADPEVQAMLQEPELLDILQEFKDDPVPAHNKYIKEPSIRAKIEKLLAAGM